MDVGDVMEFFVDFFRTDVNPQCCLQYKSIVENCPINRYIDTFSIFLMLDCSKRHDILRNSQIFRNRYFDRIDHFELLHEKLCFVELSSNHFLSVAGTGRR